MTRRAARIMVTSIIITIGIACVSTLLIGDVYAPYAFVAAESLTACYALSHGIIMAACFILIPIEKPSIDAISTMHDVVSPICHVLK